MGTEGHFQCVRRVVPVSLHEDVSEVCAMFNACSEEIQVSISVSISGVGMFRFSVKRNLK